MNRDGRRYAAALGLAAMLAVLGSCGTGGGSGPAEPEAVATPVEQPSAPATPREELQGYAMTAEAPCRDSDPQPGPDEMLVHLLCGLPPLETRPVVRPAAPAGADPAQHVLDLVREGPTEAERVDGFKRLSTRGDLRGVTARLENGVAVVERPTPEDGHLPEASSYPEQALMESLLHLPGVDRVEWRPATEVSPGE